MQVDQIYKKRFSDVEGRRVLWETLTKRFFQDYIEPDDTVLDVPCGYGEFINTVQCKEKIALDINPDSKLHLDKTIKFIQASSTEIPLEAESVDKIFVSNFFEHISREDIQKTVEEFRRILRPGGAVLVLQPNIRLAARDYWMFFDHITPVDDRALEEIFSIKGFVLKKRILRFLPYTSQSKLPINGFLVKLYLSIPVLWRIIGKQTFMLFVK